MSNSRGRRNPPGLLAHRRPGQPDVPEIPEDCSHKARGHTGLAELSLEDKKDICHVQFVFLFLKQNKALWKNIYPYINEFLPRVQILVFFLTSLLEFSDFSIM